LSRINNKIAIIIFFSSWLFAEEIEFQSAMDKRIMMEKGAMENPFIILPHRPNYLIPMSYSKGYNPPYQEMFKGKKLQNIEAKFQVSMKYIAIGDFLTDDLNIMFAFTSTSWWQSYNSAISSPFRETNYEPEMIFSYIKPYNLGGFNIRETSLSFNHQSNGKSGTLSRSWNRIIGGIVAEKENWIVALEGWYRIPEKRDDDDNSNIEEYLGYGQLGVIWKVSEGHNLDMTLRNNLKMEKNRGSIELGWSFPLSRKLRGYVQYFNGYGEGLIYYNHPTNRIGLGVKLTDWL
jgi:phospholipase A1